MKIGILGSRGIPNEYGGFEECAQQIGVRLVKMGHRVTVYNSHRHSYDQKEYEGVEIVHKYDPEHRMGTIGQFIYDFNCIIDARWRKFDVILLLGYTSSSLWQRFMPSRVALISNMDGLEWKRSKYKPIVQRFLKRAEKWAALGSNVLIADAEAIRDYLNQQYKTEVVYVPYGATKPSRPDKAYLKLYNLEQGSYNLIVARLEPENNIETILKGVQLSKSERVMLVVGNHETPYGEWLKATYRDSRIRFVKATFKKENINTLRQYAHLYFHGHSVGGTNPSLLEAMACKCLIVAHRNPFNLEVLAKEGNYFMDENDVVNAIDLLDKNEVQKERMQKNLEKIEIKYNWDLIAEQYEVVLEQSLIGLNR